MSVEGVELGTVALSAATRDLTAPLVLLRQLSFQLDAQLANGNQANASEALEQIRLTVERTFAIADQLKIAVAQVDSLSLEPVQIVGLCHELNDELRPLGKELKCRLDFELPRRQDVVAVGNYQALKTVLNGFLSDALYYSQSSNKDDDRIVRVRVGADHRQNIKLTIQDDGPNFSLTKSLDMAKQAGVINPTEARPLMGSLNLLLADKLMRAMNGDLVVHNRRKGGVAIETILPVSRQLSLLGDIVVKMSQKVQSSKYVVLLEDDHWFADSLAKSLQTSLNNVAVETIDDPEVAMMTIDKHMPDLLIADLHLGSRNFLTLLNELASYPDTLALPKIILSSSGNQLDVADLQNYGVQAIYDKRTYDYATLLKDVKGILDRANQPNY